MNPYQILSAQDLEKLRALDTCTVSNTIERLEARLRNEGFVFGSLQCQFPTLPPMVGYAVTGRVRTVSAPISHRCYYDRMDWWNYVASVPAPRVMVIQDADHRPGLGAFVGEIHAVIGTALNCVGCVTNGAVRDLPAVKELGFQLFAGNLSVSHSYAHIIDFGEPVEIGGLKIKSGDLVHGDQHGVLTIPEEVAGAIPAAASKLLAEERELIEFCRSPQFSLDKLGDRLLKNPAHCDLPWRPR